MSPCDTSCDRCTGETPEKLASHTMRARPAKRSKSAKAQDLTPEAQELFERLRTLRKGLADKQRVPAYVVFNDAVLTDMALARPTNEDELLAISGVGPAKLAKYGTAFLDELGRA